MVNHRPRSGNSPQARFLSSSSQSHSSRPRNLKSNRILSVPSYVADGCSTASLEIPSKRSSTDSNCLIQTLRSTSEDNPQVIGEASILMAQTCFPKDGLSGDKGHTPIDVLCKLLVAVTEYPPTEHTTASHIDIHFGQQVPKGVQSQTIDIAALKKLGDAQVGKLVKALRV